MDCAHAVPDQSYRVVTVTRRGGAYTDIAVAMSGERLLHDEGQEPLETIALLKARTGEDPLELFAGGVFGPAEVWTKAAASAVTAVMLDAESAEAHTSLAHVKSTQDWDWLNAEREFQRAINLTPRYATAHHWYATSCLAPLGRLDEALNELAPGKR